MYLQSLFVWSIIEVHTMVHHECAGKLISTQLNVEDTAVVSQQSVYCDNVVLQRGGLSIN